MSTIHEVAKHAVVSTATVSRVLNANPKVDPELRRRVEAAVKELRYIPNGSARSLVTKQTRQVALLISGTSSIVGHESVHVGDVSAQTRETLANLRAVIESAHQRSSARFDLATADCVIYVRRSEDATLIRQIFDAEVGADSPAARHAIVLEADICRADLQVEIEAHAFAPGEVLP